MTSAAFTPRATDCRADRINAPTSVKSSVGAFGVGGDVSALAQVQISFPFEVSVFGIQILSNAIEFPNLSISAAMIEVAGTWSCRHGSDALAKLVRLVLQELGRAHVRWTLDEATIALPSVPPEIGADLP